MKLQHLALLKMSQCMEYPVGNQVVDDLVFEIESIKERLDDEINSQESIINESLQEDEPDLDDYHDISYDIYETLFRVFNYKTVVQSELHVKWKEYFHCLYEHCVVDYDSEQFFYFILKSFDLFTAPDDLPPSDPCYHIVHTLQELFDKLKVEHINITRQLLTPTDYMTYRVERGMKHFQMIKHRNHLINHKGAMEGILKWSKR